MRAALVREHGTPEKVAVVELPDPEPGAGQVLVRVHAAAINFPDVLIVADRYQVSAPVPFTPGSEFAGVGHDCCERAFAESGLVNWMLKQNRIITKRGSDTSLATVN